MHKVNLHNVNLRIFVYIYISLARKFSVACSYCKLWEIADFFRKRIKEHLNKMLAPKAKI